MPNSITVPTCPLCHTVDMTVTMETLAAGAGWHCTMCGQRWDADRLATVVSYAQYVADHPGRVARAS
jgi:transcription elongation factor Elf1